MNRRTFARASFVAASAAATGCVRKSDLAARRVVTGSLPDVHWMLASSFPHTLDIIHGTTEWMVSRIAALTQGRFQIKIYGPGELCPANQVLDVVQQGAVQIGHTASYYYMGKHPALAFDTTVPFGLDARQQQAWLTQAGGAEMLKPVFDTFRIHCLPGGNTGAQMGGWYRREIHSLADLQGLKMRIPGLGGQVMSAMGVTVQNLSSAEIYTALQMGAIDATEWVGPYDDLHLGLYQVAKYYYYPGWWEPGPSLSFYIHQDAWNALPEVYRAILECAASDAAARMMALYDARNPVAFRELVQKHNVQVRAFPADMIARARIETETRFNKLAADNETFARIYEHWKSFRDLSRAWTSTTELFHAREAHPE